MDVVTRVIWRVVLNDPVDARDVQAPRRDISTEKGTSFSVTEFEEGSRAFLLFLFALEPKEP